MCRCAERAQAIRAATKSALHGDASKIAPAAQFVAATLAQDAKGVATRLMLASRKA